jgi:starch-binding outer membrane protein, SusD/RagB family
MKHLKYIFIFLILFTFTRCGKDWLNLEPQAKTFETNYYTNEEEIGKGLDAAYDMLQNKYFAGGDAYCSIYFFSNFPSDDAFTGGDSPNDQIGLQEADDFSLTPNVAANLLGLWRTLYYGVYRANVVVHYASPATANQRAMIAEAKFLQALYYYYLVNFWGRVPLIKAPLSQGSYNQANAEINDILDYIEQRLNEAIPNLKNRQDYDFAGRYHATKSAARALLGHVLLQRQKWTDAEPVLQAIVDSGGYQLEANYEDVWRPDNKFGVESIFEIPFSSHFSYATDFSKPREYYGNIDVQMNGFRGVGGITMNSGWGFDLIDPRLRNLYNQEKDWVRKNAVMYDVAWVTADSGTVIISQENHMGPKYEALGDPPGAGGLYLDSLYFSKKRACWRSEYNTVATNWGYGINERVLRYADVLLMLAEAKFNDSKNSEALALINQIRTRAKLPVKSSLTYDDIKLERRLELAMEGWRFFDLKRWGDAASALTTSDGFVAGKSEYFPIPLSEITKSGGMLVQNPGY